MDYELQLKVKNAPMLNAMRVMGINTAAELSRLCGVDQGSLGGYLNLKKTPYLVNGNPSEQVLKIARTLCVHFESLFPEKHLHTTLEKNTFATQVMEDDMLRIESTINTDPARMLELDDVEGRDVFADMLETAKLTPRESRTMRMRLVDGETLVEVAESFNVTCERIRQIEAKALRKMRQPDVRGRLVDKAGIYAEDLQK